MIINHDQKEPRREAGALGWQVYKSEGNRLEQTKVLGDTPDPDFVLTTKKSLINNLDS